MVYFGKIKQFVEVETEGDTVTLHRPDLSLRSIEFDCDWEGGGGKGRQRRMMERDNWRYTNWTKWQQIAIWILSNSVK